MEPTTNQHGHSRFCFHLGHRVLKLGLAYSFGALPPIVMCGFLQIGSEIKLEEDSSEEFASSATLATEAVSAIRTVASLTLENKMLALYQERLGIVTRTSVKALALTMLWYAFSQSMNFLLIALGFYYGGLLVSTREYTNVQFFVFLISVVLGGENAAILFRYIMGMAGAAVSAKYIFWLRQRAPDADNSFSDGEDDTQSDASQSLPKGDTIDVQCQAIEFAYPSRPQSKVISSIDINVEPVRLVTFVSPSGCNPTSDSIVMGGRSIRELGQQAHRGRLALAQQELVLYEGSVRENMAMGLLESKEVREAEVETACRDANILDFVSSLPEGLATDVSIHGDRIKKSCSSERTSALDTESERLVQVALNDAARDGKRTTIAVAHRLGIIGEVDCIFCLPEWGDHRDGESC
ncbi:unnamed protein product [Fusarium venenatum]|uniref:ABC transmembrane type-1 domain-containing protein n=1 Tax=Fusarium venenatum TaxID=56646 RepID=A0A2L2U1K1_9HYPO|nr:LOW QUALITY PROTEIN: uncharacterized protein FVRRES_08052 [Fusarium venenatum]CEI67975.1 unnamed protein product [Fusarium venenatum]